MKHFSYCPTLFLACSLLIACACRKEAPSSQRALLLNGDFSKRDSSGQLLGWTSCPGTVLETRREGFFSNQSRAGISADTVAGQEPPAMACLQQTVAAATLRGHRVVLRAEVRAKPAPGGTSGQCFLRVDRQQGQPGFFDNMEDRQVSSKQWTPIEVVGDVAADAVAIGFGAILRGPGQLWVRKFSLDSLGATPKEQLEPSRPLEKLGLANLEAFAKALNYLRYFHPSDEGAKADWNRLAAEGIRRVEASPTPKALATALQTFFAALAPTAIFAGPGEEPKPVPPPAHAVALVQWSHRGFGLVPFGAFHSERTRQPLPGQAPDPLQLDLGRGITLWLPRAVYAGADGATLPKGLSAPLPRTGTEPTAWMGSPEDRATRLGSVCLAWGAPQHFYPYFEKASPPWAAELPKALRKAAVDRNALELMSTLRILIAALKDGHGRVLDPGAQAWVPPLAIAFLAGKPYVRAMVQGLGEKAQLVLGSELLEIDGEAAAKAVALARREISAPSQAWMEACLARELLQGPQGTEVRVAYRSPAGVRGELLLERTMRPEEIRQLNLPEPLTELQTGIWYLDLDRLNQDRFDQWLAGSAQKRALIVDLRGYPRIAPTFLQHLLQKKAWGVPTEVPWVSLPDRHGWIWDGQDRLALEPLPPGLPGKVVFLAGGASASQAESWLAMVKEYNLAQIVGERTAGANGQYAVLSLPCGMTMTFTAMRVRNYDGTPFNGVGVAPDQVVKTTRKGLIADRDEPLEKALAILLAATP